VKNTVSKFAFKFNMYHYNTEWRGKKKECAAAAAAFTTAGDRHAKLTARVDADVGSGGSGGIGGIAGERVCGGGGGGGGVLDDPWVAEAAVLRRYQAGAYNPPLHTTRNEKIPSSTLWADNY
jgi:hypothetical protein